MGRFSEAKAWLRWWTLLGVVVVVTATTVDNKPADGYLHSGYFWPKTLYWRGIRHPPGIYWFVFYIYLSAVLYSLKGSLSLKGTKFAVASDSDDSDDSADDLMIKLDFGYIFTLITTILSSGLLFISVAATNLSDVVQAYLIGMCIVQVVVDALRSLISCNPESVTVVYFTVINFMTSSVFGIALLDSYRPLNQLNCAYSIVGAIIVVSITAASLAEKKGFKKVQGLVGFIAGLLQMVFCGRAYFIANQVADVNKTQTAAFFYTALVNFLIVSFTQIIFAACPTKTVTETDV